MRVIIQGELLFLFTLLLFKSGFTQEDWRLRINDEWFKEVGIKGLQVGDTVPDFLIGKILYKDIVADNYQGKARLSDFKDKLIILDFWTTSCSDCIAAFPKMEKLQQDYKNQVQIFLVNMVEDEKYIRRNFPKNKVIPNLPCIVANVPYDAAKSTLHEYYAANPLSRFFPTRGVPHHVWIDSNSVVKVRGSGNNTYAEKVCDYLQGKLVYSLASSSNAPILNRDPNTPYFSLLGCQQTPVYYGSFITPYNNQIGGHVGEFKLNITDSTSKTKRSMFINCDVMTIYREGVFGRMFLRDLITRKIIYTPDHSEAFIYFPNNVDKTAYKAVYSGTDKLLIQSKYCYEQIVPIGLPEAKQRQYMLEDLNRYFGEHLGMIGAVEKRTIPCYVLARTSKEDKVNVDIKEASQFTGYIDSGNIISVNGKKLYDWKGAELRYAVGMILGLSMEKVFRNNRENNRPYALLNETGWESNKKISIRLPLPTDIKTLEDMRNALKPYDLDIIETEREIEVVVFKKPN
jgi:thiol-disulfide isomerase/thioredoxin